MANVAKEALKRHYGCEAAWKVLELLVRNNAYKFAFRSRRPAQELYVVPDKPCPLGARTRDSSLDRRLLLRVLFRETP